MHIAIVEDDKRVAELLQRAFEEEGHQITLFMDGTMAREQLPTLSGLDLLIVDIMLPGMNGIELCRYVRRYMPRLPVLMLTALGATDDKLEGFDAGADDYLVKPFEIRELMARVRALHRRHQHSLTERYLRYADVEMDTEARLVRRAGRAIHLTPKEFHLLRYMLQNPERVISKAEIAEKVWGIRFDTGTNFIDVYINYLRKKIDKDFSPRLIHTRTGMGFIFTQRP